MALRPGAMGMFLWAVEEGVTRRTEISGRLMTTAWVAVGRKGRVSPGAAPGAVVPERPGAPAPGRGAPPGRVCTAVPGRLGPGRAPGR